MIDLQPFSFWFLLKSIVIKICRPWYGDIWQLGRQLFYFLILDSSCGFVIRKFVKLQILVIYCCYLTNFSFLHLPLRSLTIFLVKLLRLPPNRKPCDFIKPDCEYPSSVYLTECTPFSYCYVFYLFQFRLINQENTIKLKWECVFWVKQIHKYLL